MPESYVRLDGAVSEVDLVSVVGIVNGWSKTMEGWEGYIVYSPNDDRFIELMSTVPDVRGDADTKSVEVSAEYVKSTYNLTSTQISQVRSAPSEWKFIKKR